jgi:alpha-beta hydrolase superfamily lysophospholipase
MTRLRKIILIPPLLVALVGLDGCAALLHHFEPQFLETEPNGAETPKTVGLKYERIRVPSGPRQLDGYLVRAQSSAKKPMAILIFHGVKETISDWVNAQRFLHDNGVSSMVFDYSGHGNSSKPGTFQNLNEDAVAAYSFFVSRFPPGTRLCILGHSMGNGPMLAAIAQYNPAPARVVVANPFTSLRDEGAQRGTWRIVLWLIPDVWNNVKNVAHVRSPIAVVHSDTDTVIPIAMGKRVFAAAPESKKMITLHGFQHNALLKEPSQGWWDPVLRYLRD